ncbi:MAG: TRAP transporter small permease [Candidatus Rokuibacteriota bacterium]
MTGAAATARRGARRLARLNAGLYRATCVVAIALLAAIFVIMILQIAFRYVLNAPLVWTEEAARYLYIWACYLGAAIALRRGSHIAITLVLERLPGRLGAAVALGSQALALLFLGAVTVLGVQLMARTHTIEAITLPIPWSVIYAAAPVGAVLMLLQTLETLGQAVRDLRGARP